MGGKGDADLYLLERELGNVRENLVEVDANN